MRGDKLGRLLHDRCGQSTVEYVIVLGAFLVVAIALGALWRAMDGGTFIEHVLSAASHHVQSSAGGAIDAFLY